MKNITDFFFGSSAKFLIISLFAISVIAYTGCGSDDGGPSLVADFDYDLVNDNLVSFENKSSGDYYSIKWNFGNGRIEETTNKSEVFRIPYGTAGDYIVSITLLDFVGNTASAEKTISIGSSNFSVAFTADVSPDNANIIKLNNQTVGAYDSFKWIFRGREVENELSYDAYFPFSGNYTVRIEVIKDGISYPQEKNIVILADDPDYVNNLTLTWSDEFDGADLNTDNWTYETGASGWGNQELQNYTAGSNADVTNGNLIITARKINDNTQAGSYTSSRLISKNKQEFQYGRLEIRAKLPAGRGIWPAIWMLGGNFATEGWPACGEIDIMEYVGYEPNTVHATIHTISGSGGSGNGTSISLPSCEEEFHDYGIIWTKNKIQFYIDDPSNITHTYAPSTQTNENWPFDQTAFFILNIAVGGTWGGAQGIDNAIFPQTMEVDYVRVYQETL